MTSHEQQFEYRVFDGDELIDTRKIDDPFIRTTICIRGFWNRIGQAWKLLSGQRVEWRVHVDGSRKSYAIVFGADYTPDPPGPAQAHELDGAYGSFENAKANK